LIGQAFTVLNNNLINPIEKPKFDCVLKHFTGYDFSETFLMLDDPDSWGRLKAPQEMEVLSVKEKGVIQKRDMGKLGSRLGSLSESEYEQMILSDIELLHGDCPDLQGRLTRIASVGEVGLC
jgi:hypothetical protein